MSGRSHELVLRCFDLKQIIFDWENQGSWFLLSFGSQLDPKFWFFPGLYNYAIVYVASIFGFEDLTVKFLEIDEYLQYSRVFK